MQADARFSQWIWIILLAGLLLRLAFALGQPTLTEFDSARGGDTGWFLANGYGFFSGKEHGWVDRISFYNGKLPTPPLYILYAGIIQQFFPTHETIIVMRVLQCLASVATVYLACRISALITGDHRVATVVAILAAFHPAFVMEPANISTETLYIFFLVLGFWIYINFFLDAYLQGRRSFVGTRAAVVLAALAFALATLTRAVSILFPLVIVLHLLFLGRRHIVANWRSHSLLLLIVYAAMVSTWTIHNLVLWNRFVVVSNQLLPALWRGAESGDGAPSRNDALLMQGVEESTNEDCQVDCKYEHPAALYVERIREILDADLAGFVALRLNELSYSLVQPHGTAGFGEVSIREAAADLIRVNPSPEGLLTILQIEGFVVRIAIWISHFAGIGLGLVGMYLSRDRWQLSGPLVGFVLYTVAAHFFLLALPRYLFPLEVVWLIFTGIAAVLLYERWTRRHEVGAALTVAT